MIALDDGDKIRGDASVADEVDYTLHGLDANIIKQLANGQLPSSIGDLYTADSADVVSTIVLVNTGASTRTVNLYLTPSGGVARRIIPKDCSLSAGYSLHTDGARIFVVSTTGEVVQTYSLHASSHTDGTDDIQDATAAQKGVMTAAYGAKLDGIEAAATADLTAAEIVALLEALTAGSRLSHTKLDDVGASDHHTKAVDNELYGKLKTGVAGSRPAAGNADTWYYSTDTKVLEYDTGAAWIEVARGETATRLAQLSEKAHGSLTGVGASDHHTEFTTTEHTAIGDGAPHHTKYTNAEAKAQAEAAKLDDHAAPDDNTDLDASDALHGLMSKADKGKLDGVDAGADVTGSNAPQAHKDSHDPVDGSDKLDSAAPVKVGSANAIGSSHSFSRADHVHEREHAIYTDAAAKAAAVQAGAITDGVTKAPTHDAVFDVKSTADAALPAVDKYTDAEAVDAIEADDNLPLASITFIIDGGGSAITTGQKGHLEIPFACTLNAWTLVADVAGAIVIDIWKDTYANFPPDNDDAMPGAGKEPTIAATNQKAQDLDISDWATVAVAAGDVLAFNVDSCTTITRVTLSLKATKT